MTTTRASEHKADTNNFPDLHNKTGDTEGGACLTGHVSGRSRNGYVTNSSCNYRWQAYKRAQTIDFGLYNYPRYESLCAQPEFTMMTRLGVQKAKPAPYDWDIKGKNFQTACTTPYWHEGHHIVPHGELRDSIGSVGTGPDAAIYVEVIRGGLLEEKYNLNHMTNMIILPLDNKVARAIKLPRHRHTSAHRSHRAYSNYVRGRLDSVFGQIRQEESAHTKKPEYKACKKQIENISETTRKLIVAAGGEVSLDEAFAPKSAL